MRPVLFLVNRVGAQAALGLCLTIGLVLIGLTGWGLGSVTHGVLAHQTAGIDRSVERFVVAHRESGLTTAVRITTVLGGTSVLIVVAIATGLLLWWRRRTWGPLLIMVAALGGAVLLKSILKELIHAPRPPRPHMLEPFTGYGFPAGHVAQAVAFWGALAAVAARAWSWRGKVAAWAGVVVVGVVVAFDRIYLGAQWLSDVLGGAALGAAWLSVLLTLSRAVRDLSRRQAG